MFTQLALASLLALNAAASPASQSHFMSHMQPRQDNTFTINVKNNCAATISAATFSISSTFTMLQSSATYTIAPGGTAAIPADYLAKGMRLSPNANLPIGDQWNAQPLFEYGYGEAGGNVGTAYDLSLMNKVATAPVTGGLKVVPANSACETKTCTPTNCPADQGWTDTVDDGSAADTGCYVNGKTDFTVTFCP